MKKIFLLGAYGQHNLGDDALLEVFLAQLSDSQLVVKSASPSDTQRRTSASSSTGEPCACSSSTCSPV